MSRLVPQGGRGAALKRAAIESLPARWQLPVRYRQMRLTHDLEPEMEHLASWVRPGTRAIDVGANHGLYSYALSRLGLTVEAFEPQPWCVRTLEAWARGRLTVHQAGLSDEDTTLTLNLPVVGGTRFTGYASFGDVEGETEQISVPVHRLDGYDFEDVSFIKIDVEGHELSVLRGAEKTLDRNRPLLLIEIEERHLPSGSLADAFAEVESRGYAGEYLLDGRWQPLSTFSVERLQRARLAGDDHAPYVNNFLFRPVAA